MIRGKVVGTVVSTKKNELLTGSKFLTVQYIVDGKEIDQYVVAVDGVGAGIGEEVLVTLGSSARMALPNKETPADAVIVGIID